MTKFVHAAAAAVALFWTGAALAQAGGGGNGPAIGNQTTTSMGSPNASPGYQAPRSSAVPGLPPQARTAQQWNQAQGQHTDQGIATPVQGPKALNGKTQNNPTD